jgi:hypothetical protein
MPKKRRPESDPKRSERLEQEALTESKILRPRSDRSMLQSGEA